MTHTVSDAMVRWAAEAGMFSRENLPEPNAERCRRPERESNAIGFVC